MSKIISIDVGIKNLGLCIFCINNDDTIDIVKWQTISLMGGVIRKCDGYTSSKSKCENVAKYKFENECFCGVHKKKGAIEIKKKNAEKVNMVTLGKNMKDVFDELLFDISGVEIVLIENQISPIANRMKTIQGMIMQYFIMNGLEKIEMISSQNKLKIFDNYVKEMKESKGNSYNVRKKMGIMLTQYIITINEGWSRYNEMFIGSKKDDLADSFLQGLYYIKRVLKKEIGD
tara:strand:- start:253 stop:945 length:693 start_codon:yes stop_codon:yes gene_type:complete